MISKTIGFRGTLFSDTPICGIDLMAPGLLWGLRIWPHGTSHMNDVTGLSGCVAHRTAAWLCHLTFYKTTSVCLVFWTWVWLKAVVGTIRNILHKDHDMAASACEVWFHVLPKIWVKPTLSLNQRCTSSKVVDKDSRISVFWLCPSKQDDILNRKVLSIHRCNGLLRLGTPLGNTWGFSVKDFFLTCEDSQSLSSHM